jgi:hypothetical protein
LSINCLFFLNRKSASHYPRLEKRLFKWIKEKRANGVGLDGVLIVCEGMRIAEELGIDAFKGTRGWLYRFLVRFRLTLRRATTTGSRLPQNAIEVINSFHTRCNNVCDPANIHESAVYGGDHFCITLDSPLDRTYDEIGVKRVPIVTAGAERVRLSVMACASADGVKLPLEILVPRKTPIKVRFVFNILFLLLCFFILN